MRIPSSFVSASCSLALVVACGGSDDATVQGDDTPYTSDPDKTVVVGGSSGATGAQAGASGSGCVTMPDGTCVEAKGCADGERRDVIIDSKGKVVDVVCYPARSDPPIIDSEGNVQLDKNQNNGVVALDGADDGIDIAGNVTAAGNNVTIYGEGPLVSVIGGDVEATGNNFAMRGVTVKGNVEIGGGNNAVLVLCTVEGNVHIVGNNNVVADCDVLGDIVIEGVNNTLVANHVGGKIQVSDSKNSVCDGNTSWNDANSNKIFDAGEAGGALECTNAK